MTNKFLIAAVLAATVALPSGALAQDFPKWPLNAACSQGDDTCPRFEQFARGQISGIWPTLPGDARAACIAETAKVEKSYRLLQDCLANKMQESMKGQVNQRS